MNHPLGRSKDFCQEMERIPDVKYFFFAKGLREREKKEKEERKSQIFWGKIYIFPRPRDKRTKKRKL